MQRADAADLGRRAGGYHHAARLAVYHQRAGVGHAAAIADHRFGIHGSDAFFDGLRFAGQRRFLDAQLAHLEQAQVGRYLVAGGEQHDIADSHLFGRDVAAPPVAQYCRDRRKHVADGVQRALRLAFLDYADDGVDDHHADDHAEIHPVVEQGGDERRAEQYIDEDVVELLREAGQQRIFGGGGQGVGAVQFKPPSGLAAVEAFRLRVECGQGLLCRQAVPVGGSAGR